MIAAQHKYFNTKLQQFLKMSVKHFCCIKIPCFEELMGVEKSFSRNVTELYFQPSCSM